MQASVMLAWAAALLAGAAAGVLPCHAQYPDDFRPYTVEASVGETGVRGADAQNFGSFQVYQVGGGLAWDRSKPEKQYTNGENPKYRHWNLYLTGQFLWGESTLKGPVNEIINSNPQNPSLLAAISGKGRFYSTTAGPRLQYSKSVISLYGQAAGGWLRRSIDLTGVVTQGTALQPNNPSVFGQSANSSELRISAGIAVGAKGVRAFGEVGFLQGFAINHGTMLAPMISGGVRW